MQSEDRGREAPPAADPELAVRSAERRANLQSDPVVEEIIGRSLRPVSAYRIAQAAKSQGICLAPAQVYRCLARLVAAGRIARVASLRGYVSKPSEACVHVVCRQRD